MTGVQTCALPIYPNRQPFPASDGSIAIVPYTEQAWPKLLEALGAGAVIDDPRFATREARIANITQLYALLATLTVNHTCAQLLAICRKLDLPARPARDIAEIREDPHLVATGFFTRREHPSEGTYLEMKQPVEFGQWPARPRGLPPGLGEHEPRFASEES